MRVAVAIVLLATAASAFAQTYPSKPVRFVIPYAAGGGPDIQARQFGQKLAEVLGQPVVAENKVGAAGVLAAQYVAHASADGYTLLLGSNTHLIQKHLKPELQFDPIADFVPVSNMASSPTVMVVRADNPARSVQDIVVQARRNPGKMNFGSGGIGTSAHLAGATLAALGGFKAVHIPLKGSVEITASLLRGDTDFAFPITSTGIPQLRTGKLRALAVTSARRLPELSEVPTLAEAMKSELAVQESWFGIWAPAGTPAEVVRVLHAAAAKALADPQLRQRMESAGGIPSPSESPEAFAAFIKSENLKWSEIVKLSAAKAD